MPTYNHQLQPRHDPHGTSFKDGADDNDDTLEGIELGSLGSANSKSSSPNSSSSGMNRAGEGSPDSGIDADHGNGDSNSNSNSNGQKISIPGKNMSQADWDRVRGRSPSSTGISTSTAGIESIGDFTGPGSLESASGDALTQAQLAAMRGADRMHSTSFNSAASVANIRKSLPSYDIVNDGRSSSGESDSDRDSSERESTHILNENEYTGDTDSSGGRSRDGGLR